MSSINRDEIVTKRRKKKVVCKGYAGSGDAIVIIMRMLGIWAIHV